MSDAAHTRRDFLRMLGLGAAAAAAPRWALAGPKGPKQARKPNVVFFLVDDMGWMDSSVYGSRYYRTPNMERLAAGGMVFTDAYAANPLCSPTRASILTGKYPARLRITTPAGHLPPQPDVPLLADKAAPGQKMICPRSRRFLPPREHTIAEAFREAGYRTGFVGKWHLGLRPEHWPEKQGFELSFHGAPDPGPRSYFSPYGFRAGTVTDGPAGEYITDRLTGEAVRYIDRHRGEPFLLMVWHYGVHGPWGHKAEYTKRHAGRKDPRGKQGNAIMASMLQSIDESLGRILDHLDKRKLADDTAVIFFSDNGGNTYSNTDRDPRASQIKPGHPRWPMIRDWRKYAGNLPPTNNAPLRGGKASIYEGGTREPLIVRWPGVVKGGSQCAEIVSSIDFYPTMLQMAGLKPRPGQVIDGVSLMPLLRGTGGLGREAIFCHFPHGIGRLNAPSTYVRKGPWKLIRFYDTSENFPNARELYDLKDDIGETTNLAGKMPAKVKELDGLIDRFLKDTNALVPKPNPAYDPKSGPVQGWRPSKDCTLSVRDGVLRVQSTGGDPFVHTADLPAAAGPLVVKLRMKSTSKGIGQVFWTAQPRGRFGPKQRVSFHPTHDGRWHEQAVKIPAAGALHRLRIDPGTAPGLIEIDWIRLCKPDGTVVKAWEFSPAKR